MAGRLTQPPLGLKVSSSRNGCLGTKAAFFCDYLRRYLMPTRRWARRPPTGRS